jgi:hypothetical protein
MNGMIKLHFGNCIKKEKKFLRRNFFCGSETWTINKTDTQEMKEAPVRFLRQMFGLKIMDSLGSSKILKKV